MKKEGNTTRRFYVEESCAPLILSTDILCTCCCHILLRKTRIELHKMSLEITSSPFAGLRDASFFFSFPKTGSRVSPHDPSSGLETHPLTSNMPSFTRVFRRPISLIGGNQRSNLSKISSTVYAPKRDAMTERVHGPPNSTSHTRSLYKLLGRGSTTSTLAAFSLQWATTPYDKIRQ